MAEPGTVSRGRHPRILPPGSDLSGEFPWVLLAVLCVAGVFIDREINQGLPKVYAARVVLDLVVGTAGVLAVRGKAVVRWGALALLSSLVGSVALFELGRPIPEIGASELLGWLAVIAAAVRYSRPRRAVAAAAFATGGLSVVGILRDTPGQTIGENAATLTLAAFGAVIAGLLWRSADFAREQAAREARTEERLAIARDLHDSVASQVTGLTVQLQALRVINPMTNPELARAMADMERQTRQILGSLRQLVVALRQDTESQPVADVDLNANEYLGGIIANTHGAAQYKPRLAPGMTYPATLLSVAGSVVREALINCRRHAACANAVVVGAVDTGSALVVSVDDDAPTTSRFDQGTGLGLAGLRERAALVGGTLEAGPHDPAGWRVTVRLPRPRSSEQL